MAEYYRSSGELIRVTFEGSQNDSDKRNAAEDIVNMLQTSPRLKMQRLLLIMQHSITTTSKML